MNRSQDTEQRTVLIIDSNQEDVARLRDFFDKNEFCVLTGHTLEDVNALITQKKMDIILLILRPPYHHPEKIINLLKQNRLNSRVPVIVILENFIADVVAKALKAGAADFLNYPIDGKELLKRIRVQIHMIEPKLKSDGKGFMAGLLSRFFDGTSSDSDADGLMIGHYEKLIRLGMGSFGEVWRVKDITKDPPVIYVAKIPLSRKFNNKIENEGQILDRLSPHNGVPEIHEIIEIRNKKILIQEFVVGRTLHEVIERELEEEEIESIAIQLVGVVAHAHQLDIIHRDIKPGNVMVKPDGTIKLLDFGVAKELKDKKISATVTGSRPFMSPEQIMGRSQKASDVWALGVIMYVLYTGMFPFYHEVEKILMDMILELPPSPPKKFNVHLDSRIEKIILKCLEKKPENRYPDAAALKKDIIESLPDYGDCIIPPYDNE